MTHGAINLLREKWGNCRNWSDDQLLAWMSYFKGRIAFIQHEGQCVGVGAVRFINDLSQSEDWRINEPDGTIAWIEIVVANKEQAVASLMAVLVSKCKPCVTRIGGRNLTTGKVRLFDFNRYCTLLSNNRITYGRKLQST
jgi:hypothetical protein